MSNRFRVRIQLEAVEGDAPDDGFLEVNSHSDGKQYLLLPGESVTVEAGAGLYPQLQFCPRSFRDELEHLTVQENGIETRRRRLWLAYSKVSR